MPTFPFRTDAKSEAFCLSIAREMVELFGISEREAIRRISKFWSHLAEIVGDKDLVYHEDEAHWAKTIFYGHSSYWWFTGEERLKRNLPPLTAQPLD